MNAKEFKARMRGVSLNKEDFEEMQSILVEHTPVALLQDHARREAVRSASDALDAGVLKGMAVVLWTGAAVVVHCDFPENMAADIMRIAADEVPR